MQSKNTTRTTDARTRVAHGKGRAVLAATALALGIGTIAFASPAVARDEFKNAFEFELGRIVAHEVAAVGHAILSPHVAVRHEIYPSTVVYERHTTYREPHRQHHRKHVRAQGHKHQRNCGHHFDRQDRRIAKHQKRVAKRHDRYKARVEHRRDHHHQRVTDRRERHEERKSDRRDRRNY